jgi:hypothetical protein
MREYQATLDENLTSLQNEFVRMQNGSKVTNFAVDFEEFHALADEMKNLKKTVLQISNLVDIPPKVQIAF